MGNLFGGIPENGFNLYFHPDDTPHPLKIPANDPLEGFPKGRKERTVNFTKAELQSAKIKLHHRDYCAGDLLKFRACRKNVWPFAVLCEKEKHSYLRCQYEDYLLRMKEYERERRMKKLAVCTCFEEEGSICTCNKGEKEECEDVDELEEDDDNDELEDEEDCDDTGNTEIKKEEFDKSNETH